MKISYDKDIDYLEIFFSQEENYGENISDNLMIFKSEKSNKIIGYGFDNASKTFLDVDFLSLSEKLAILLKIFRTEKNLTQDETATKSAITLRQYQRIEAGETTTTDTLEKLMKTFSDKDFSRLLKNKTSA